MVVAARHDPVLRARITTTHALRDPKGLIVRAGSALLRVGKRLMAVQDDAFSVAWIDPASLELEFVALRDPHGPLPKPLKPDLEAACAIDDSVYVLGSGATALRRFVALIRPGQAVQVQEARALYAILEKVLGIPNIEGAVPTGDTLQLLHRGSADSGFRNAIVTLNCTVLDGDDPQLHGCEFFDLGAVGGQPLTFTDAALLPGGGLCYLAVAENAPDAIADGPVIGCAIGMIGKDACVWTQVAESDGRPSVRKPEGLVIDADAHGGWLLTDPDDATLAAELCRVELDGFSSAAARR